MFFPHFALQISIPSFWRVFFFGILKDLEGRARLSRAGILVRMMEQANRLICCRQVHGEGVKLYLNTSGRG